MIAFVQVANAGSFGSTSVPVTFGSPVTAGNLIVVIIFVGTSGAPYASVTDSLGNGPGGSYAHAGDLNVGGHCASIFYAWGVTGGADTVTAVPVAADYYGEVFILEYSGVMSAGDPLDGFSSQLQNSQTVMSSGNLTTTVAGDVLIAGFQNDSGGCDGNDNGMIVRSNPGSGTVTAKDTIVLGAPGTYAAQSNAVSGANQRSIAAAFKAPSRPSAVIFDNTDF